MKRWRNPWRFVNLLEPTWASECLLMLDGGEHLAACGLSFTTGAAKPQIQTWPQEKTQASWQETAWHEFQVWHLLWRSWLQVLLQRLKIPEAPSMRKNSFFCWNQFCSQWTKVWWDVFMLSWLFHSLKVLNVCQNVMNKYVFCYNWPLKSVLFMTNDEWHVAPFFTLSKPHSHFPSLSTSNQQTPEMFLLTGSFLKYIQMWFLIRSTQTVSWNNLLDTNLQTS